MLESDSALYAFHQSTRYHTVIRSKACKERRGAESSARKPLRKGCCDRAWAGRESFSSTHLLCVSRVLWNGKAIPFAPLAFCCTHPLLNFLFDFFFLLRMSFVVGGVKNTVGLYNPLVGAQGQLEWSKDNPVVWEGNYFVWLTLWLLDFTTL